jgi:hypothetical protein
MLKQLRTEPILDKISKHKINWIRIVDRMQKLPKPTAKAKTMWIKEPGKIFKATTGLWKKRVKKCLIPD